MESVNEGINVDREAVVFYCNEGMHAAFDWFVAAKILGFENAKIYDGSMSEWAEDRTDDFARFWVALGLHSLLDV